MAQELDGLPDLWGSLRRLLKRLLKPRESTQEPTPAWSQDETRDEADSSAGWSAAPVDDFGPKPATRLTPKWAPPSIAKVAAPSQPVVQRTLAKRLRDRRSLKQAIVVNELLKKPLALRRRGG